MGSLGKSSQDHQNGSSKTDASVLAHGNDDTFGHMKFLDGETFSFQDFPPFAEYLECGETLEFLTSTCPVNLETIFSPTVGSNDVGGEYDRATPLMKAHDNSKESINSHGFQACCLLDPSLFHRSVAGLPVNGIIQHDEIVADNFLCDFECAEQNMMLDVAESCMTLPALEERVETIGPCAASSEEHPVDADGSWFNLLCHQIKPCDQEFGINDSAVDSAEADCFDPQLFIRNCPDLSEGHNLLPELLPMEVDKRKCVTLVLDLDETLVHSSLEPSDGADFRFQLFFDMKEHTVYVRQRPYLKTFLERVAEMFEIMVFTASESIYAEQILDILDPDRKFFSRRAYRESCKFSDGNYTKDLTVLGVDLAKIAIIDNCPQVFQLQVDNGIPIESWFDDPSDSALISLLPFLETLVDADDVRPIIAKRFRSN